MKKSGIYLIINEITKMVYVGQSVDIYQRLRTHKSNLKRKNSALKALFFWILYSFVIVIGKPISLLTCLAEEKSLNL